MGQDDNLDDAKPDKPKPVPMSYHEVLHEMAYKGGVAARFAGKRFIDCPYYKLGADYQQTWVEQWQKGFIDGGKTIKFAYYEGVEAYDKGFVEDACPYPAETFRRAAWIVGHTDRRWEKDRDSANRVKTYGEDKTGVHLTGV